jgi:hypothetical protein
MQDHQNQRHMKISVVQHFLTREVDYAHYEFWDVRKITPDLGNFRRGRNLQTEKFSKTATRHRSCTTKSAPSPAGAALANRATRKEEHRRGLHESALQTPFHRQQRRRHTRPHPHPKPPTQQQGTRSITDGTRVRVEDLWMLSGCASEASVQYGTPARRRRPGSTHSQGRWGYLRGGEGRHG